MSQMTCPTVKVKAGDSHIVINESDFDPAVHVKFDEPLPPPPVAAPVDLPPPPAHPLDGLADGWKDKPAAELKKLAEAVSGRAVENKQQAVELIEAALAERAK